MIRTVDQDYIRKGYRSRYLRLYIITGILLLVVLVLCGLALMFGSTHYRFPTIIQVLLGHKVQGATFAIKTLRLPRMLTALLTGIAFGMAGSTFQTILRNPLASPDIIGITSGSSVAAVFCILVLQISGPVVSVAAVVSGLLVAALIYGMSKGGAFSGGRLILIGIGVQAMLNSIISFLLLRASQYDVPGAIRWLSGSLNGVRLYEVAPLLMVVLICGSGILVLRQHLSILELGEQSAIALGVRTDLTRMLLVISAVCLIAFATAVTGPIAFIAFLSGPIGKKLVGSGVPSELPAGLIGAILVLAADLIGQYAFEVQFPVGVITGILGAPYLIFLLIRMNRLGGSA